MQNEITEMFIIMQNKITEWQLKEEQKYRDKGERMLKDTLEKIKGNNPSFWKVICTRPYYMKLNDSSLQTVLAALQGNDVVNYLYVDGSQITDKSVPAIIDMLQKNKTVTVLELDPTRLSDPSIGFLTHALKENITFHLGKNGSFIMILDDRLNELHKEYKSCARRLRDIDEKLKATLQIQGELMIKNHKLIAILTEVNLWLTSLEQKIGEKELAQLYGELCQLVVMTWHPSSDVKDRLISSCGLGGIKEAYVRFSNNFNENQLFYVNQLKGECVLLECVSPAAIKDFDVRFGINDMRNYEHKILSVFDLKDITSYTGHRRQRMASREVYIHKEHSGKLEIIHAKIIDGLDTAKIYLSILKRRIDELDIKMLETITKDIELDIPTVRHTLGKAKCYLTAFKGKKLEKRLSDSLTAPLCTGKNALEKLLEKFSEKQSFDIIVKNLTSEKYKLLDDIYSALAAIYHKTDQLSELRELYVPYINKSKLTGEFCIELADSVAGIVPSSQFTEEQKLQFICLLLPPENKLPEVVRLRKNYFNQLKKEDFNAHTFFKPVGADEAISYQELVTLGAKLTEDKTCNELLISLTNKNWVVYEQLIMSPLEPPLLVKISPEGEILNLQIFQDYYVKAKELKQEMMEKWTTLLEENNECLFSM